MMKNTEIWPFSIYFTYPQPTPFLFTSLPSAKNYCVNYICFHACTSKATERRKVDLLWLSWCEGMETTNQIRLDSDWFWLIQILLVWRGPRLRGKRPGNRGSILGACKVFLFSKAPRLSLGLTRRSLQSATHGSARSRFVNGLGGSRVTAADMTLRVSLKLTYILRVLCD